MSLKPEILSPNENPSLAGNTPDKLDTLDILSPQANQPQAGNSLDRLSPQANPLQAGSTLLFYLAILIFIIGFNFTDTPHPSGWYQQFMPNLNNQPLNDITFIDSLNGWAVTQINTTSDSGYILKTTNGGDNWTIRFKNRNNFKRVIFINSSIGYTCGIAQGSSGGAFLYKSTNAGDNWFSLNVPNLPNCNDMFVLNVDTIWIVENGINGSIYRTIDGANNWSEQISLFENPINKIYMYNRNIGFACTSYQLFRTMNSGQNWVQLGGGGWNNEFIDMYFADSLNGWKSNVNNYTNEGDTNMVRTTNGGLNWHIQRLPSGGLITASSGMYKFSKNSKDTIRGTGGSLRYSPTTSRGIIYITTNGGNNWLFQLPDTSFGIPGYYTMNFVNNKIGWSYVSYYSYVTNNLIYTGIHTTTGGDTVWYIGIVQQNKELPKDYVLKQNYPNPFNPRTVIPYSLKSAGYVRIIAYDILGREIQRLVDQKQNAGEYEVDFMGKFCSSGVYFYRMTVDGNVIGTRKMLMLK